MKNSILQITHFIRCMVCLLCVWIFTVSAYAQSVTQFVTYGDQSKLLEQLPTTPTFTSTSNGNPTLAFDPGATYQTIDGFGYTLTQGSAYVLMTEISSSQRAALLQELFDPAAGIASGIGASFLRIAIGASDMSQYAYTYNDLPAGQTDVSQSQFSLQGPDMDYVIPILQEVIAINPNIKIKAVPWTAPAWMKTNGSLSGGNLKPEYYASYATYFVKYLQAMQGLGIPIYAVAPQNEPEHCCNNPAMLMTAQEQINFILELGPAIQSAGFSTKILTWDHNCDVPEYPIEVLGSAAGQYVDGAAFHLYAGDISALSTVHDAFPNKNIYFTEQYTGAGGSFLGDLAWHMKNVVLGGTNNWAKAVLEWNLAADANQEPHTSGGCTNCLGALTLEAGSVTRNVAYYIIGQVSKFVRPGAVRVATTSTGSLTCAGFINNTANGNTRVLVVHNDGNQPNTTFNIEYQGKIATVTLPKKGVGTYIWTDEGGGNNPPTAAFTYSASNLNVDFDGATSSDSDGTISSWAWDYGDGTTGNGQLASHSYGATGSYTVSLTVTDNGGATDTDSQVVSVSSGGTATSLYVQSITTGTQGAGQGNKYGTATVTILDDQGSPVNGANVTGTFSGTFNETVSGQTGANGAITLQTSSTAKGGVTVNFCVDNVSHTSLTYDDTQNVITCTNGGARTGFDTGKELEESIKIYPNPVKDGLLHFNLPQSDQEYTFLLADLSGRIIYSESVAGERDQLQLPKGTLCGMYVLSISGTDFIFERKIILE